MDTHFEDLRPISHKPHSQPQPYTATKIHDFLLPSNLKEFECGAITLQPLLVTYQTQVQSSVLNIMFDLYNEVLLTSFNSPTHHLLLVTCKLKMF